MEEGLQMARPIARHLSLTLTEASNLGAPISGPGDSSAAGSQPPISRELHSKSLLYAAVVSTFKSLGGFMLDKTMQLLGSPTQLPESAPLRHWMLGVCEALRESLFPEEPPDQNLPRALLAQHLDVTPDVRSHDQRPFSPGGLGPTGPTELLLADSDKARTIFDCPPLHLTPVLGKPNILKYQTRWEAQPPTLGSPRSW